MPARNWFAKRCNANKRCNLEEIVKIVSDFYKEFPCYFPDLCFLWKCCSTIGFSQEFSTRAQILKNGFSKKWVFLSAFWERKLEKWLTIFARTYCRVIANGKTLRINVFLTLFSTISQTKSINCGSGLGNREKIKSKKILFRFWDFST